ncbi:MAG: ABC transporter permease [Anaerolineae bacterium]|nr:ABC transporter permease [Anaerolineae bacterium]
MQTVSALSVPVQSAVPSAATQTLSRPTSAWRIIWATVGKELRAATRYVPNLIGSLVDQAVRVVFFLLLSATISIQGFGFSGQPLAGHDLFISFQSGLLLTLFIGVTLWGPIHTVRNDLYNGTLEFLYSNPGSRYAYYVGSVLAKIMIELVLFVPLYVFLAIYSRASVPNLLMVLLACAVILVALTAMGVMVALLALLWRQVDSIVQFLGVMFEMIGGAYLPVTAFPILVRYLAYPLPHTWGYDLIRYYSFGGNWQTLLPVWQEWGIIVAFAIGFTLASRYLLGKAEHLAKKSGLHVI